VRKGSEKKHHWESYLPRFWALPRDQSKPKTDAYTVYTSFFTKHTARLDFKIVHSGEGC